MDKKMQKLNLKVHCRRKICYLAFIQAAGLVVADCGFIIATGYVPYVHKWINSAIITNILVILAFIIIDMCIGKKVKSTIYCVDVKNKICIKKGKKLRYRDFNTTQSFMQKLFGLCTLKFENTTGSIIMKDVSVEAKKYLE